jgi:hypothetical protein
MSKVLRCVNLISFIQNILDFQRIRRIGGHLGCGAISQGTIYEENNPECDIQD